MVKLILRKILFIILFFMLVLCLPAYLFFFMLGLMITLFMDSMDNINRGFCLQISQYWIDLMTGDTCIYSRILDKIASEE